MKLISKAVVGFVDIVSSTTISNTIDIHADYRLKKAFQDAATLRAEECDIIILNDTGDGFLFLANREGNPEWHRLLLRFHAKLTQDFKEIIKTASLDSNVLIDSGLRFGVTSGSVLVGSLRGDPSQMAAIGPDVNLAARLCAKAEPNEIVMCSRVWAAMSDALENVSGDGNYSGIKGHSQTSINRVYSDLKGFTTSVAATHMKGVSV